MCSAVSPYHAAAAHVVHATQLLSEASKSSEGKSVGTFFSSAHCHGKSQDLDGSSILECGGVRCAVMLMAEETLTRMLQLLRRDKLEHFHVLFWVGSGCADRRRRPTKTRFSILAFFGGHPVALRAQEVTCLRLLSVFDRLGTQECCKSELWDIDMGLF